MALTLDEKGVLWVGTQGGGLSRFNPADETFKTYTMEEGLPSSNIASIIPDKWGELWISTSNGLSRFNVEEDRFINYDISYGFQVSNFYSGAALLSKNGKNIFRR